MTDRSFLPTANPCLGASGPVLVLGILVQFNGQEKGYSLERERFRGTHVLGSHDNDDRSLPCAAGRVLHVRKPAQSQREAMARREKRVYVTMSYRMGGK